jgi:hypothetical protein
MSQSTPELTWTALPGPLRALGRWLTLVQVVGYTTSLLFVWQTTRLHPAGIAERYRGAEPAGAEGAMVFPKSFPEMLTLTHTHLFSMAAIFALSGLCLSLCSRPASRWRTILIVEPFAALLVSFGSMWLMRYLDPRFSWLLAASSTTMAATFYLQSWCILRELGWRERRREAAP